MATGPDETNPMIRYARTGAEARLAELLKEIEFIYRSFPELRNGAEGLAAIGPAGHSGGAAKPARQRRHPRWTAAMKKEAADRMKKYWAARRAAARKG